MSKQVVAKTAPPSPPRSLARPKTAPAAAPLKRAKRNKVALEGAVIKRSDNLGEGYFLIKVKVHEQASPKSTAQNLKLTSDDFQRLPLVTDEQVTRILSRLKAGRQKKRNSPRGKASVRASEVPNLNTGFLANFAKQEIEHRTKLEKTGELIDSSSLADRMGLTRQAINKAVTDRRMFALDGESGKKLYPAFFSDDGIDRRKLQAVSKALGHLAGSSKWQFFTNPRLSLGKQTPIEALRRGKFDEVMVAAAAFREA
jgi:hypothetical protein